MIRSLRFEAAETAGLDPDRLSFVGRFRVRECRLPECDRTTPGSFEAWDRGGLRQMQEERTEARRNRIDPRVIKLYFPRFDSLEPLAGGA